VGWTDKAQDRARFSGSRECGVEHWGS